MLAVELPPELDHRLDELARKTGRTKSYYAHQAIAEYIEDLEDIALAEERLRTSDGSVVSWAEIKAKHFDDAGELK